MLIIQAMRLEGKLKAYKVLFRKILFFSETILRTKFYIKAYGCMGMKINTNE